MTLWPALLGPQQSQALGVLFLPDVRPFIEARAGDDVRDGDKGDGEPSSAVDVTGGGASGRVGEVKSELDVKSVNCDLPGIWFKCWSVVSPGGGTGGSTCREGAFAGTVEVGGDGGVFMGGVELL